MDKTKVLVIIALLISICSFGKEVSNIPGQASADNENIPQSSGRPVQTLRGVVNDRASGHPIPYATIQLTDIPTFRTSKSSGRPSFCTSLFHGI